MSVIIKDGTGKGNSAKVDSNNRIHVDSVSRTQSEQAALVSNNFNVNTGAITLTSGNESAIGYIEYTGDDPLVIKEILVIIGSTTGGSGDGIVKIVKNPTAGTIVSNATAMSTVSNRDFSSSKVLPANSYKGVEGATLTDGSTFADTTRSSFGTVVSFDAAVIVLKKGNSIGVTYQPPAGNTSQIVKIAITCFVEEANVVDDTF